MHGLVFGLLHATVLAVLGFFVLFAASKAAGLVKLIGNILGIWIFVLAILALFGGAIWGPKLGGRMMGYHWGGWGPPAATSAPASNAAPAPK